MTAMGPTMATIGYYGPSILMLLNIWNLRNITLHVFLYVLYILALVVFTKQLKGWIREPRPYGYNHDSNKEWMHDFEYSGAEIYGMPSGHSATLFFSLLYLWFYSRPPLRTTYMIVGAFVAFLTLYQRYQYRKHTVAQLAAGAILGVGMAYLAYLANTYVFV